MRREAGGLKQEEGRMQLHREAAMGDAHALSLHQHTTSGRVDNMTKHAHRSAAATINLLLSDTHDSIMHVHQGSSLCDVVDSHRHS